LQLQQCGPETTPQVLPRAGLTSWALHFAKVAKPLRDLNWFWKQHGHSRTVQHQASAFRVLPDLAWLNFLGTYDEDCSAEAELQDQNSEDAGGQRCTVEVEQPEQTVARRDCCTSG